MFRQNIMSKFTPKTNTKVNSVMNLNPLSWIKATNSCIRVT